MTTKWHQGDGVRTSESRVWSTKVRIGFAVRALARQRHLVARRGHLDSLYRDEGFEAGEFAIGRRDAGNEELQPVELTLFGLCFLLGAVRTVVPGCGTPVPKFESKGLTAMLEGPLIVTSTSPALQATWSPQIWRASEACPQSY